jgi:hypothetical protein
MAKSHILGPFMEPLLANFTEFGVSNFVKFQRQSPSIGQVKIVKDVPPNIQGNFAEN